MHENYYFEDDGLLFGGWRFGALARTPKRWSGLPVAPLNWHPSADVSTEPIEWLGTPENAGATRRVLLSALNLEED